MATRKSRRVKTANGGGSVTYNVTTRRWMGRYSVPDPETGRSLRKTLYGASEQEARAKLIDALAARNNGSLVVTKGRGLNVEQYAARWLAARVGRLGPRTHQRYAEVIKVHINNSVYGIGKTQLTKLQPTHIDMLMSEIVKSGRSARTANYARQTLRAMLNQAMTDGLIGRNVAALAKPLPQRDDKVRVLAPAHIKVMLRAAESDPDGALWIVALATGARRSELLGLRWGDVDLETGELRISRTLQWEKGWLVLPTKTQKSTRTLNLPAAAIDALHHQRRQQREARLAAGAKWSTEYGDLIFSGPHGEPLSGNAMSKRWAKRMNDLGLPSVSFHGLRHSAASLLAAQHVPMFEVSRTLGHSNIATTSDLYSEMFDESRKVVASAMDKALTGK